MKKCPYCAEEIQDEAIKCRYCGEWLDKIQTVKASIIDSSEKHFANEIEVEEITPSTPTQPSTLTHAFKEDPTNLTATLKIMLWVFLGLNIILILSNFAELNLLKSVNLTLAKAEAIDTRQQVLGIIYLIVYIITGITFLKWIYRANLNVRGFGVRGLKFTPGWSIGYYFIPLANYYKPYQAMREIWKASKNPDTWEKEQGSPLLVWWWTLWIILLSFGKSIFWGVIRADTITKISETTIVLNCFIWMVLTAVAISLVSRIFEMQRDFVSYHK